MSDLLARMDHLVTLAQVNLVLTLANSAGIAAIVVLQLRLLRRLKAQRGLRPVRLVVGMPFAAADLGAAATPPPEPLRH